MRQHQAPRWTATAASLLFFVLVCLTHNSSIAQVIIHSGIDVTPFNGEAAVTVAAATTDRPSTDKPAPPPAQASADWLLLPSKDKMMWSKATLAQNGWASAFRQYWIYGLVNGPYTPPNGVVDSSKCMVGQDAGNMYIAAPSPDIITNRTNKDCILDSRRFKYVLMSMGGAGGVHDPTIMKHRELRNVVEQCGNYIHDAAKRNSTITIKDLNTGKVMYQGSMDSMAVTAPAWLQQVEQSYNGSCGNGTYQAAPDLFLPFSQGMPDYRSSVGVRPSYFSPTGFVDFCGVKGPSPGYAATRTPAAYSIAKNGSLLTYTNRKPPTGRVAKKSQILPLGAKFPVTMAGAGLAFAIDVTKFMTSPEYDAEKGLNLEISWASNVMDARNLPIPDEVDLMTWCSICRGGCENFYSGDPAVGVWDPAKVTPETRKRAFDMRSPTTRKGQFRLRFV